jgi:hypothetical protein
VNVHSYKMKIVVPTLLQSSKSLSPLPPTYIL